MQKRKHQCKSKRKSRPLHFFTTRHCSKRQDVTRAHHLVASTDFVAGWMQPKPVDLMKGRQIEDLSCGLTHNVVVTAAGEVVSLFAPMKSPHWQREVAPRRARALSSNMETNVLD
jgi:hypothetical protein